MMKHIAISIVLFTLTAGLLSAGPVNVGGAWYEFWFGAAPSQAFGCVVRGTHGCGPSSGGDSQFASDPPYTITVGSTGSVITIQDAFVRGDQFSISVDGGPFLPTSAPINDGANACANATDPASCQLNPTYSHGVYALGPGTHTFTINVIQNAVTGGGSGAAYFRIDPLVRAWTALTPAGTAPVARADSSGVFSEITNELIMFGGNTAGCSSTTPSLNDTWVLSAANGLGTVAWNQASPTGTLPAGRRGHSAVYNPSTDNMIVFGGDAFGCSNSKYNDLWVLSNASGGAGTPAWTTLNPTGSLPPARSDHVAVYDRQTDLMIVFGGTGTAANSLTDLWVLTNASGVGGTPAWTNLTPAGTGPATTSYMTGTYDVSTDTMTLFAGFVCCAGPASNQVWLLSNASGAAGTPTWSNPTPGGTYTPPARVGAYGVYSPRNNKASYIGGSDTNIVWDLLDANGVGTMTWTPIVPAGTLPPPRGGIAANPAVIGDGTTARIVIFGGGGSTGMFNDVWVLSE